jgi:hypothetical protein
MAYPAGHLGFRRNRDCHQLVKTQIENQIEQSCSEKLTNPHISPMPENPKHLKDMSKRIAPTLR